MSNLPGYMTEAQSLGHMLELSCAHWGDKVSHLVPEKGEFHPTTYRELYVKVRKMAAVLLKRGWDKGHTLCIYSENSFHWAVIDWAGQCLGIVMVPIYPTLPGDQASYIVQDCGAEAVLCGSPELAERVSGFPTVLIKDLVQEAETADMDPAELSKLIKRTQRDEIATIIYTSGTTGNPKGAMLLHGGFLDVLAAIKEAVPFNEDDLFLGFLPMSHVFERTDGHFLPVSLGATIAYAQSLASIGSDIQKVRPTIMLVVPRFLESMRNRILDGVLKQPPVRQKLFHLGLTQGTHKFKGEPAPLFALTDKVVGSKIRERLGGRFRFFASGGAALPAHTAEFYGAFGLPVLQGYGLTETYSGICINRPESNQYKSIGHPFPRVEMKIAEDGEILIRGTCVMKGYFNLPKETAEAIDSERWFHSGDIGVQEADGRFRITDRKKDLLILGNGKNVAPQPIENLLKESSYINEAVLFGDGMEYVCGLIFPDFERVKAFASREGIHTQHEAELLKVDPVKKLFKAEIDAINKKLADFEKVKRFQLVAATLSIETGELTPSLKVKRKVVAERFKDELQSMMRT